MATLNEDGTITVDESAYEHFTKEEVDEGRVYLEKLIKDEGEPVAKLVVNLTLLRAQVLNLQEIGLFDAATAHDLLRDQLQEHVAQLIEDQPEVANGSASEFADKVLRLVDEFTEIGTRAATNAAARDGLGDGEGFAANGGEAEGSL